MFMTNIELFGEAQSPHMLRSENLLKLVNLNLANCDAPSALMKASAADIANLVSVGQNRSMRLYYLAIPADHVWLSLGPEPGTRWKISSARRPGDGCRSSMRRHWPFRRHCFNMVSSAFMAARCGHSSASSIQSHLPATDPAITAS